jgi:type I restriction enzyme R subunit
MPSPTSEHTFENAVLHEMTTKSGWIEIPPAEYDRQHRLVPSEVEAFLRDSQPKAVEALEQRLGDGWLAKACKALTNGLREVGDTLQLLRRGKTVSGVKIDLAYFKPTHGKNPETLALYAKNRLTVIRQVPYSPAHQNTLDLVLVVNGIPVADAELKNGGTQVTDHAVAQYRNDRDPGDEFMSRRSVVHFAFDPQTVVMTTTLKGEETRFLPFNRGSEPGGRGGAGNYVPADGSLPTSYLWREVWQRDNWLDLIQSFIHVEEEEQVAADGTVTTKRKLIFPRYHQWDCVKTFVARARERGAGQNELAEASTGSGKTNVIGWLAHRLANLFDDDDEKVFDKVICLTDRVVLNKQLRDKVEQFESTSAKGMVVGIRGGSAQLKEALESPAAKIIVTTIQTFPFVLDKLDVAARAGGNFAVIIDEAHSSQSGESAAAVKKSLTSEEALEEAAKEAEGVEDEDVAANIAMSAAARGQQDNISMFAFTATPKAKTLEVFGEQDSGTGLMRPTHLYSMRQAVEEGFIMDMLLGYTTYKTYYKIATESEELGSEEVEKSKALSAVRRFATLHPTMIGQKVEIIIEHFREFVQHEIGGKAKAMIVTPSRLHAVRYKLAIDAYLHKKGYTDLKALVAFSGKVIDPEDPGEEYTEPGMNGFAEKRTEAKFDSDDYQVMVVAEKFQTGFSQPLIAAMYVDKKLAGLTAVQTLSRGNRIQDEKSKTFVLDFVNDIETIEAAYSQYWGEVVGERTDPQVMYETWERIASYDVITDVDVDAYATAFFAPDFKPNSNAPEDKAKAAMIFAALNTAISPAVARFGELDEDDQDELRRALRSFASQYGFLTQIIPWSDNIYEKRYQYARYLSVRVADRGGERLDISDILQMTHFHTEATHTSGGKVVEGKPLPPAISGDGHGPMSQDERVSLLEVLEQINTRHGLDLGEEHLTFAHSTLINLGKKDTIKRKAGNNSLGRFLAALPDEFEQSLFQASEDHLDFAKLLMDKPDVFDTMLQALGPVVWRRARKAYEDEGHIIINNGEPEPHG